MLGGFSGSYRNDVQRSSNGGATWTSVTSAAQWTARRYHTALQLHVRVLAHPALERCVTTTTLRTQTGRILVMGGYRSASPYYLNDVWESANNGASWTLVATSAPWSPRDGLTAVLLQVRACHGGFEGP